MYEKIFKGNETVRQLRFRQGRRNDDANRGLLDTVEEYVPYAPCVVQFRKEISLRVDHEGEIFRAKYLRKSTHFPGIVPELVSDSGDYLLITWLTFGSMLRLLNEVRRGKEIRDFKFFLS